jgi:hypothetical protein
MTDSNPRPPSDPEQTSSAPVWAAPAGPVPTPAPAVPASTAPSNGSTIAVQKAKPRRGLIDILLVIGVVVALAGIGFAVGRLTAPATTAFGQGRGGQFNGNGQFNGTGPSNGQVPGAGLNGGDGTAGGRGFLGGGGLAVTGKVTELTADHVTIELANGQAITVAVDGSTTYHQQTSASTADVQTGDTVIVQVQRGAAPGASPSPGNAGRQGGFGGGTASDITITAP